MTSPLPYRSRLALAAVCLSSLMFGLEISSVPAILPLLERAWHADLQQLQWTMNAYTIAVASVLMAAGTLADRYGRRRVFILAIVAFGVTSLVCGLSPSMPTLIAGRALQGASGGAMLICQIAVLSQQFTEPRERATAFGWWGIVFGMGLGFGPAIGSGIAALSGWTWVFLVHALVAIPTVVIAAAGVHESKDPHARRLDLAGIVTLSLGVFTLVLFITEGAELGFASPVVLALIAAAVVSFVAFVVVEQITPHPMFDFAVFRVRPFSGALLGSMGMNFSFWPFMIYLPIWFESGLGLGNVATGLALLTYTLPTLVVPPFAERLSLRHGPGVVIPAGLFVIGAGFLVMKIATDIGVAAWPVTLLGALIAGVGLGATNTPVTNTTTGSVSSDRAGMASGIDMSARMISLAINIALMGFVLVEGVVAHLDGVLGPGGASELRRIAERIAAGAIGNGPETLPGLGDAVAHDALARGFSWVMLYGGVSIWVLAALSLLVFGRRVRADASA